MGKITGVTDAQKKLMAYAVNMDTTSTEERNNIDASNGFVFVEEILNGFGTFATDIAIEPIEDNQFTIEFTCVDDNNQRILFKLEVGDPIDHPNYITVVKEGEIVLYVSAFLDNGIEISPVTMSEEYATVMKEEFDSKFAPKMSL